MNKNPTVKSLNEELKSLKKEVKKMEESLERERADRKESEALKKSRFKPGDKVKCIGERYRGVVYKVPSEDKLDVLVTTSTDESILGKVVPDIPHLVRKAWFV